MSKNDGGPAFGQWLPIESAPRDGTLFDMWMQAYDLVTRDSDEVRPTVGMRVADVQWWAGEWCDENGAPHEVLADFKDWKPTYWMPIPPPPAKDQP